MEDGILNLEEDGEDFILSRTASGGTVSSIRLSERDIMRLGESVQPLRDVLAARRSPRGRPGMEAAVVTDVAQFGLNAFSESILLTMITLSGAKTFFAFPPDLADRLVDRLTAHVAALRAAQPKPQ